MTGSIDPSQVSVDQLIQWVQTKRLRDAEVPLGQLLGDVALSADQLIDVACIDLIQRRRAGSNVQVEDYLRQFPQLNDESFLLDLVDAEICVAKERKESLREQDYLDRFPNFTAAIAQLFRLPDQAVARSPSPFGHRARDASADFSMDGSHKSLSTIPVEAGSISPLKTPSWFVGESCVASSPGRWLIRGRDSNTGESLALKAVELPIDVTSNQIEQLLDACQLCSSVVHTSWSKPLVAAAQQRRIGVIRPWVFARQWQPDTGPPGVQMQRLATLAFCLAAAHQAGCAHGGVHADNVLIDHDEQMHLVDANSTRQLERWLRGDPQSLLPLAERQQTDANDLIILVAAASVHWDAVFAAKLMKKLRSIGSKDTCAQIGDALMKSSNNP